MFSYETYKVLHYASIFFMLTGMAITFFAPNPSKAVKIITGIATFFIFVAGMGLLARLGIGSDFPVWIYLKIGLWLLLAAFGPILAKRLKSNRPLAFYGLVIVACITAWVAVNKPFL